MPTPYALAIRDEVHAIVLAAQGVLARRGAFDISVLERVFVVQCHDAIAAAVGAPLIERVRHAAPRCRLRLLPEAPVDTRALRQGHVDLDISATAPTHRDLLHSVLGTDRFVVAMHAKHPLAQRKLTAAAYARAEHVIVSRRGRLRDPVDDFLEMQGRNRRVVASAPTSATALRFVSEADLCVVVPEKMCATVIRAWRLVTRPLPFASESIAVVAAWHRRYEADPAHAWLRRQVEDVVTTALGR